MEQPRREEHVGELLVAPPFVRVVRLADVGVVGRAEEVEHADVIGVAELLDDAPVLGRAAVRHVRMPVEIAPVQAVLLAVDRPDVAVAAWSFGRLVTPLGHGRGLGGCFRGHGLGGRRPRGGRGVDRRQIHAREQRPLARPPIGRPGEPQLALGAAGRAAAAVLAEAAVRQDRRLRPCLLRRVVLRQCDLPMRTAVEPARQPRIALRVDHQLRQVDGLAARGPAPRFFGRLPRRRTGRLDHRRDGGRRAGLARRDVVIHHVDAFLGVESDGPGDAACVLAPSQSAVLPRDPQALAVRRGRDGRAALVPRRFRQLCQLRLAVQADLGQVDVEIAASRAVECDPRAVVFGERQSRLPVARGVGRDADLVGPLVGRRIVVLREDVPQRLAERLPRHPDPPTTVRARVGEHGTAGFALDRDGLRGDLAADDPPGLQAPRALVVQLRPDHPQPAFAVACDRRLVNDARPRHCADGLQAGAGLAGELECVGLAVILDVRHPRRGVGVEAHRGEVFLALRVGQFRRRNVDGRGRQGRNPHNKTDQHDSKAVSHEIVSTMGRCL